MHDAYEHNGDRELMESLGLQTTDFGREWTDLGTVTVEAARTERFGKVAGKRMTPEPEYHRPAATVKVEVSAMPAQFWRFTITRPREEIEDWKGGGTTYGFRPIYEPVERFTMRTGSGGFGEYWTAAKACAQNCLSIQKEDDHDGN